MKVPGLFLFLIVFAVPILGASTAKSEEFLVSKWTTEQGLPQNTVTSIVQTSDGYIWLGTFGGLARFDGLRFTSFDSTTTPGFRSNRVLSLHANPKDGLWVGTESGEIYLIRHGNLEEFRSTLEFKRKAVWAISEDSLGNLFVSSPAGIEAYRLDDNGWPVPDSGKLLTQGEAYGHFKDGNGRIWAKVDQDIALLDRDGFTSISSFGIELPLSVYYVAFDRIGRPYVTASATLGLFDNSKYQEILALDYEVHRAGAALSYIDDRLWYQQAHELYEIVDSQVIVHDLSAYVRSGSRAIFKDNEGNLWLATQADGLIRLKRKRIGSAASMLGANLVGVSSVVEDKNGTIWFTGNKLRGIRENEIITIDTVEGGGPFPGLKSLAVDDANRLWTGGIGGLFYVEGNNLIAVPDLKAEHVLSLYFDAAGRLWVGTEKGLFVRSGETFSRVSVPDGRSLDAVHCITQLHDGSIWLGTNSGIFRVEDPSNPSVSAVEGFTASYVREIAQDSEGVIWIGTYGRGISRLKYGVISSITRANGLPNNFISRILIGNDGRFWVLSNFGVFAVTRTELMDVADGSAHLLGGAVFGVADGMTSSEANGGHQPAGIIATDGKLWFPMIDDLVSIDSSTVSKIPPKVLIENAVARTSESSAAAVPLRFNTDEWLELKESARNLEINYTGLSYTKPEALRFVFKLEGLDQDWIDGGNRRRAFYGYLPPGDYQFLVKAINADGVWSDTSASLKVRVAERFWESRWFAYAIFATVLGLMFFVYRNRERQLRERQGRQEAFARQLINASEQERQRISKELHDGLSQNLLLMKNWSALAKQSASRDLKESLSYLDKIGSTASDSLDETRMIIENLGPQNLRRFGLTDAILNVAEQMEDAFGVVFEKDVENVDGLLEDESELSVYRMVQEVLNNIVKHSDSPRGRLAVHKDSQWMTIVIADFGTGFEPDNVRAGHGLRSLQERAKMLRGSIGIKSAVDRGTEVTITIPVNHART